MGQPAADRALRLLFLTLEYKAGTFSGNGVYAQSMVRSLAKLGHTLLVISAAPPLHRGGGREPSQIDAEKGGLVEIPVPVWGTLDRASGWREFAEGMSAEVRRRVVDFGPDWALVVDWSAVGAYKRLVHEWESEAPCPPLAYLNYRVYTVTDYKSKDDAGYASDREFYRLAESSAVASASAVLALSARDARLLETKLGDARRAEVIPHALLPPIREDVRAIAVERNLYASSTKQPWAEGRKYFSCCVRLSQEKNALLFSKVVAVLATWLRDNGVVPLLCGGALTALEGSYAAQVRQRLLKASPEAVIVEGFMGPQSLAGVYLATVLNFHPCVYDAYGMTIVEAAAFSAPSVVHEGGDGGVGSTDLLPARTGLSIAADLTAPVEAVADAVKAALQDRSHLALVGEAASKVAMAWSEEANARELARILKASPQLPPWPSAVRPSEIGSQEGGRGWHL